MWATRPADLPPDWYERWEERAAIRQYDGRLPQPEAEAAALVEILQQMRAANMAPAAPRTYTQDR